ncbi:Alpha-L-rhamnosidase like protein [Verticillium longisporum]|uniref:Alpha-L-rhamnosidase like protein n=1 Tax=Verticillium longisporum TaxID=100787 RepID=A0A8I2ZKT3_VERLO|nr:Alpha-L-rhamnosidase like protein [Verticillium longisporum]
MAISIAQVIAEHHHDGFGLFTTTPRLSWRFNATTVRDWKQASYDMRISRNGQDESYHVVSPESILVPWPSSSLASRERASVKVRATGRDGQSTDWASLSVEVALLYRSDWSAELISARLYATAHGVYEVEINGRRVGDHLLAPGWQSYQHRLHYQTYDVTSLLQEGKNVIGAHIAEGWFATRLGRPGVANIWGNRLGFLGQVEIEGEVVCASDASWDHLEGPLISSELYNGEICDSNLEDPTWSTTSATTLANGRAHVLPFPTAELIAPEVAPVRQVMELKAKKVITTPSGKKILDFGQNFVGWLRVEKTISSTPDNRDLIIRHAEVMEHEELGIRPLRTAKCQYTLKLGGPTRNAQTRFTFYGFRFAEITGYDDVCVDDFTGVVISSDLRRTGGFESSHAMLNKLHANTVWSMRGNFVSVPTDCPQRDERLGWTGDLQVFAPTANFLYDTAAFLGSWMRDVEAEQRDAGGVVPVIIPNIPKPPDNRQNRPMAIWADCAVITPWDLYNAFGDKTQLATQWESMRLWLDLGVPRDEKGFYSTKSLQYGDWLDPRAPANMPGNGPTDNFMVANAYLICTTDLAGKVGRILGKAEAAERYEIDAARLRDLFRDEYVTKTGRLACDTQTSYALALRFGLFDDEQMATACGRLDYLTRWEQFKITTGFAGTPMILKVLADNGMLNLAYRMLQERDNPSWAVSSRDGVPPNAEARVVLEGIDQEVGSGEYVFETLWETDPEWPPSHIAGPQGDQYENYFVA